MSARQSGICAMHNAAALREARALFMPHDRSAAVPAAETQTVSASSPSSEDPNHASRNTEHGTRLPFFRTDDRVTHLLFRAEQWRNTPFCPNSAVRGPRGGVSCHNYPRELYIETGAFPETFPVIKASPHDAHAENLMETFLDARPEFQKLSALALANRPVSTLQPGDLLGLWLARDSAGSRVHHHHTNHLGIYLGNGVFTHVLMLKHVDFDLIHVPPWQQRLLAAWRPLELTNSLTR